MRVTDSTDDNSLRQIRDHLLLAVAAAAAAVEAGTLNTAAAFVRLPEKLLLTAVVGKIYCCLKKAE